MRPTAASFSVADIFPLATSRSRLRTTVATPLIDRSCGDIDEDYGEACGCRDLGDPAAHRSRTDDPDYAEWHGLDLLQGSDNYVSECRRKECGGSLGGRTGRIRTRERAAIPGIRTFL